MRKYVSPSILSLLLCLGLACRPPGQVRIGTEPGNGSQTKASYRNPVLNQNFADPTVIQAPDGYYYAYGTNSEVNGKTLHIQVAKSKDMVNWELAGDALPQKPTWADKDFWAPHVSYDPRAKTYYLYYSGESTSTADGKCLGVATAKTPTGPFVDKGPPLLCGKEFVNIDPMAFDDPVTGKKLLYWGSGFEAIKVQELADDRLSFKPGSRPVAVVQPVTNGKPDNYENLIEGAWVVYRNGYYYLYYSGDNCCGDKAHYAVMVARAKNATGPFETLAQATGRKTSVILERNNRWLAPGHNSVVTDAVDQDWIVYHAIVPEKRDGGRVMLLDKITYANGWPQIETSTPSENPIAAPVVK